VNVREGYKTSIHQSQKTIFKTFKYLVMKTQDTTLFTTSDKQEMNTLGKEVKETVANNQNHQHIFSAADLWNIQRMKRVRVYRNLMAY
jgi:hypothetical protein